MNNSIWLYLTPVLNPPEIPLAWCRATQLWQQQHGTSDAGDKGA